MTVGREHKELIKLYAEEDKAHSAYSKWFAAANTTIRRCKSESSLLSTAMATSTTTISPNIKGLQSSIETATQYVEKVEAALLAVGRDHEELIKLYPEEDKAHSGYSKWLRRKYETQKAQIRKLAAFENRAKEVFIRASLENIGLKTLGLPPGGFFTKDVRTRMLKNETHVGSITAKSGVSKEELDVLFGEYVPPIPRWAASAAMRVLLIHRLNIANHIICPNSGHFGTLNTSIHQLNFEEPKEVKYAHQAIMRSSHSVVLVKSHTDTSSYWHTPEFGTDREEEEASDKSDKDLGVLSDELSEARRKRAEKVPVVAESLLQLGFKRKGAAGAVERIALPYQKDLL